MKKNGVMANVLKPEIQQMEGTVICLVKKNNENVTVLSAKLLDRNSKYLDIFGEGVINVIPDITQTAENEKRLALKACNSQVNNNQVEDIGVKNIDKKVPVINNCVLSHSVQLHYASVGYLTHVLERSRPFRRTFCKYCRAQCQQHANRINKLNCSGGTESLYTSAICIYVTGHQGWVDYKWNYRLAYLLSRRMQLDDSMNWLNTLGGGYSALGDTFTLFAERAGQISVTQLQLAQEMGDPPTVIRCKIYFALSLMQRGFLRQAKYILRQQYQLARQYAHTDHRLINTCVGLWTKLTYYYKHKPHLKKSTRKS